MREDNYKEFIMQEIRKKGGKSQGKFIISKYFF